MVKSFQLNPKNETDSKMFFRPEQPKTQNLNDLNAKNIIPLNQELKINKDNLKINPNHETSSEVKKE